MKTYVTFAALLSAVLLAISAFADEPKTPGPVAPIPLLKLNTRVEVNQDRDSIVAPAELRDGIPCDAQSVFLARFPLGPNATERLVHVWFEPSNLIPGDEGYAGHHTRVMFEVDVFAPKASSWKRVSFARYKSSNWPDVIETRFLQPKIRRGAVIALFCTTLYGTTELNVATMRDAIPNNFNLSTFEQTGHGSVQTFDENPDQVHRLNTDTRGITSITQTVRTPNKSASTKVLLWNGVEYLARATKH